MEIVILIIVIAIIAIAFIYYSKINIHIRYQRKSNKDDGEVKISGLGGLVHYRVAIPAVDFKNVDEGIKVESEGKTTSGEKFITKEKLEHWYEGYEVMIHRVKLFQESLRWFMAQIQCNKWEWKTTIGTGDAAEAGILTGVVWGVKTNILGFISHYIQWGQAPQLDVVPSFQRSMLDTKFESDFSLHLGSAIKFVVLLLMRMRKG